MLSFDQGLPLPVPSVLGIYPPPRSYRALVLPPSSNKPPALLCSSQYNNSLMGTGAFWALA